MPIINLNTSGIVERIQLHLPPRFSRSTTGNTYKLISGIAAIFKPVADLLDFVYNQTTFPNSSGTYVDTLIEDISGLRRKDGESDDDYRTRYLNFNFIYNISPTGITKIVTDYTGLYTEPKLRESTYEGTAFYNSGFYTNDPLTIYAPEIPDAYVGYIIFPSEPDLNILSSMIEALDWVRMTGTEIFIVWPNLGSKTYSAFERMYNSDDLSISYSYTPSTDPFAINGTIISYSSPSLGISFTDTISWDNFLSGTVDTFNRTQTSGSSSSSTGYPSDWVFTNYSSRLSYRIIEDYSPGVTRRETYTCNTGNIVFTVDTNYVAGRYGILPSSITRSKSATATGSNLISSSGMTSLSGMMYYNTINSNAFSLNHTLNASGNLESSTGVSSGLSGQYYIETRTTTGVVDNGFDRLCYTSGGLSSFVQSGNINPLGPVIYDNSPWIKIVPGYTTGVLSGLSTGSSFINNSYGLVSGTAVYFRNSSGTTTGQTRNFNCPTGMNQSSYYWTIPYIISNSNDLHESGRNSSTVNELLLQQSSLVQFMSLKEILRKDAYGRTTSYQRTSL